MLASHLHDITHILCKAQLLKSLGDMVARDGLLAFLFADLVCFGGDERYELDAAFN